MALTLTNGTGRTTSTRLETLEGGSFPDGCLLDDEFVGRELVVIFGISNRALQSLTR